MIEIFILLIFIIVYVWALIVLAPKKGIEPMGRRKSKTKTCSYCGWKGKLVGFYCPSCKRHINSSPPSKKKKTKANKVSNVITSETPFKL